MRTKIDKKNNFKVFIIPMIAITVVILALGIFVRDGVTSFYYEQVETESLGLARSYSQNLAKAVDSRELINNILDEKLRVASKTAGLYSGNHTNEILADLTELLEIDVIYSYDENGVVIHSSTGDFIGWEAYEGHPVKFFMTGDINEYVEDIRPDSETGILYKFAYVRADDGTFVQIGVLADRLFNILSGFEFEEIFDQTQQDKTVTNIHYIDNEMKIKESTDSEKLGKVIDDPRTISAINIGMDYGTINEYKGKSVYEVFVPMFNGRERIGTLAVTRSMEETNELIQNFILIGLAVLAIVYGSLMYIMIFTHKRSARLHELAYYDELTGLPNKNYLKAFLEEEIKGNQESNSTIVFVNCSNIKVINLLYGFSYGDRVLEQFGKNIHLFIRFDVPLFRFSAGRFVLYMKNFNNRDSLSEFAGQLVSTLNQPIEIDGDEHYLRTQVSIVELNQRYKNADHVIRDALLTLDNISNSDSLSYQFFDSEMQDKIQRQESIERDLRNALLGDSNSKIYVAYQPQVSLKTGEIVGFEALARLNSEKFGNVSPTEFIEIAEKNQLIVPLGNFILRSACEFLSLIHIKSGRKIKMSVNVSAIQLLCDDYIDIVMETIESAGVPHQLIELEITESVILENYELINDKLKKLKSHGIDIALDDFGTGYSSFIRFNELNIDTVKIDRYFINKINNGENGENIVGEIIAMSQKKGLIVVAEGVEDVEQKQYLIDQNCDIMQGYLFSMPITDESALNMITDLK